jgi:hypothetical protein
MMELACGLTDVITCADEWLEKYTSGGMVTACVDLRERLCHPRRAMEHARACVPTLAEVNQLFREWNDSDDSDESEVPDELTLILEWTGTPDVQVSHCFTVNIDFIPGGAVCLTSSKWDSYGKEFGADAPLILQNNALQLEAARVLMVNEGYACNSLDAQRICVEAGVELVGENEISMKPTKEMHTMIIWFALLAMMETVKGVPISVP